MDRQIRRSTGTNWSEIFKILWVLINIWPGLRHKTVHKFRLGPRLGPIQEFSWSWSQNLLGPCPVDDLQYLLVLTRSSLRLPNYYEITFFLQFCHHFDQAQKSKIFLFERFGPLPWNLFVKIDFLGPVNPESKRIWVDNPSLIQQKSELIILKSDQMNQNPARNWHSNYGEWIQRLHDWYYFRLYCIHPISNGNSQKFIISILNCHVELKCEILRGEIFTHQMIWLV